MILLFGLVAPATADSVYVAGRDNGIVFRIDTVTNTHDLLLGAVGRDFIANGPFEIAITPDGTRAYVVVANVAGLSRIWVENLIDTTEVLIDLHPFGAFLCNLAITPNGAFVYVTDFTNNEVHVIATASNTEVAVIPVGTQPCGIAISPDGTRAWVTHKAPGTVWVINTATNKVVVGGGFPFPNAPILSGFGAIAVAITPNGDFAYVSNGDSTTVTKINTATNLGLGVIGVGTQPRGLAITPDGTEALVVNRFINPITDMGSVSVIRRCPGRC
jgi:YVTN family beta-propeller protein